MPRERGKDPAERFAAAVDAGRSPLSAGSDADLARELAIVARLRSREGTLASHEDAMAALRSGTDGCAPHADEKALAKQRLMAMLGERAAPPQAESQAPGARVVAFPAVTAAYPTSPIPVVREDEPADDLAVADLATADERADEQQDTALAPVTPLAGRPRRRRHSLPAAMKDEAMGRRTRARLADERPGIARRAGVVGSAALFVLIAFTGTGVFVSRDALPGQTLYPLKRAAEAAGLAMTFGDEDRARRSLELAALRLGELEQLVALRGSGIDPQVVRVAMSEFDVATSEGSRAFGAQGGRTLQAWAATQSARLAALRPSLPDPALSAADTSIALLDGLIDEDAAQAGSSSAGGGTGTSGANSRDPLQRNGAGGVPGASTETTPSAAPEDGLPTLQQPESGALTSDGESSATTSETPTQGTTNAENPRLPLPLPGAPVTLPPLLPGMPPLTIG